MMRIVAPMSGPSTHNAQQGTALHRRPAYWLPAFALIAILALAGPAFATTDNQAIPPIVQKSAADYAITVPDIAPPIVGSLHVTAGHPSAVFVAQTQGAYQTALFVDGLPVSFAQPQTGYANQSAATQQSGFGINIASSQKNDGANIISGIGMNLDATINWSPQIAAVVASGSLAVPNHGATTWSPPATLIAVVATQADTGLGAFAFSS